MPYFQVYDNWLLRGMVRRIASCSSASGGATSTGCPRGQTVGTRESFGFFENPAAHRIYITAPLDDDTPLNDRYRGRIADSRAYNLNGEMVLGSITDAAAFGQSFALPSSFITSDSSAAVLGGLSGYSPKFFGFGAQAGAGTAMLSLSLVGATGALRALYFDHDHALSGAAGSGLIPSILRAMNPSSNRPDGPTAAGDRASRRSGSPGSLSATSVHAPYSNIANAPVRFPAPEARTLLRVVPINGDQGANGEGSTRAGSSKGLPLERQLHRELVLSEQHEFAVKLTKGKIYSAGSVVNPEQDKFLIPHRKMDDVVAWLGRFLEVGVKTMQTTLAGGRSFFQKEDLEAGNFCDSIPTVLKNCGELERMESAEL